MRTTLFSLLLFSVVGLSCSKEEANLPQSIKAIIAESGKNCTCIPFINKYLWRNKTVYMWSCGGPACNCSTNYFDEAGVPFQMETGYMPDEFLAEAQLVKQVWRCAS